MPDTCTIKPCFTGSRLRIPTSNLSLYPPLTHNGPHPKSPKHKFKDHIMINNPFARVHILQHPKISLRLRRRPNPSSQPRGAGYLEEFKARRMRSARLGAALQSGVFTLVRAYNSFANIPEATIDYFALRKVEHGRMMFHAFGDLARMDPNSGPLRPLYVGTKKLRFLEGETFEIFANGSIAGQWIRGLGKWL